MKTVHLNYDVLIVGGGAAGCFSALTLAENPEVKVVLVDKANVKRSGCLAAGVNALNAYITEGESEESYLQYIKREFKNIVRDDLVITIAEKLNHVTRKVESLGLPILKDKYGNYVTRGKRSVKINGENIKPILYEAVCKSKNVDIINNVNIFDYIVDDGKVVGAYGFSVNGDEFYVISAKATICATGGAAGIYKPNNSGFSRHKMWYSPFNTGAGYAMGIRTGAEMTTFEMRFIALRCKDTIAPTGTIAQGVKAQMINSKGEEYVSKYGKGTTVDRLYATIEENKNGNGPCYLKTKGISKDVSEDLIKAYLNMAPAQALKWAEDSSYPRDENVEIDGTEPYIVGGHTASGYWVDKKRATTIKGLFAAGDVCGGSPKKYVTGAFAEGEIAALSSLTYIETIEKVEVDEVEINLKKLSLESFFDKDADYLKIEEFEKKLQEIMEQYAGGRESSYSYSEESLNICDKKIEELLGSVYLLKAKDNHQLLFIQEIIDRIYVSIALVAHLKARKETRWRCYNENKDHQYEDKTFEKYINSIYKDGKINIIYRDLIGKDENYEH